MAKQPKKTAPKRPEPEVLPLSLMWTESTLSDREVVVFGVYNPNDKSEKEYAVHLYIDAAEQAEELIDVLQEFVRRREEEEKEAEADEV